MSVNSILFIILIIVLSLTFLQSRYLQDLRYSIRKFFRRSSKTLEKLPKSKPTIALERQVDEYEEKYSYVPTYRSSTFAPSTFTKILSSPKQKSTESSHYIAPSFIPEPSFVKNQRALAMNSQTNQVTAKPVAASKVYEASNGFWKEFSPASRHHLIEEATVPTVIHSSIKETDKSAKLAESTEQKPAAAAAPAGNTLGKGLTKFSLPTKPANDGGDAPKTDLANPTMPKLSLKLNLKK